MIQGRVIGFRDILVRHVFASAIDRVGQGVRSRGVGIVGVGLDPRGVGVVGTGLDTGRVVVVPGRGDDRGMWQR